MSKEKQIFLVTDFKMDIEKETPAEMSFEDLIDCYRDASTFTFSNVNDALDSLLDHPGHRVITVNVCLY